MSIIRDFIEYYRLPEEIKSNLLDFEVKHTLLNGSENRYYYSTIGPDMYIMLVDMFTSDGTRYHRKIFTYGTDFRIMDIVHEYDFGKKRRSDLFEYGSGVTDGAIIRIDTEEHDVDITWDDPEPSTGWPYYDFGGRVMSVVAGDNITVDNTDPRNPIINSTGASREEVIEILSFYDITKIFWYTYVDGTYGSRFNVPTNDSVQHFTIPAELVENTIIRVHCWGGGALGAINSSQVGGYTYGELIVKSPANFVESNPSHVMNGMVMCVHVGNPSGRAAIWRYGTSNFNSYTAELLVAGGAGGQNASYTYVGGVGGGLIGQSGSGGSGGSGTSVTGGGGGTQTAGGAGGVVTINGSGTVCGSNGDAGFRVWGRESVAHQCDGYLFGKNRGGDGYYGGGGGADGCSWGDYDDGCGNSGGGGGSSFLAPGLQAAFTDMNTGNAIVPPYSTEAAWGLNAGTAGNPGRVAFEIIPA